MGEDSGEKTEEPTPNKLREARKKGQVSKSKDLTTAVLLFTAFFSLRGFGLVIWGHITDSFYTAVEYFGQDLTPTLVGHLLQDMLELYLACVLPLFLINFGVAIFIEVAQVGFLASTESIQPNFGKLNPVEGFKKFASLKQYVELVKSLVKMFFIVMILIVTLKNEFYIFEIANQLEPFQIMAFVGNFIMKTIVRVGAFYLFIAFLDFLYQRYEYIKSLKMSKKEIKDEYKRLEGDPIIKQRQRDAARQLSQGRQSAAVPGSDVVVTNPTHFAVAILYRANIMGAPTIVAKGQDLMAQEIRRIAEDHYVPIVENPDLARGLYYNIEVGGFVPHELFEEVAQILAFVYNLKKKNKTIA